MDVVKVTKKKREKSWLLSAACGAGECRVSGVEGGKKIRKALQTRYSTCLFEPAVGFVGLGFEFCDRFNWETGGGYFGFVGGELVGEGCCPGQGAAGFFIETGADG